MGLFGKKNKEVKKEEIPKLAELPKLPELNSLDRKDQLHQLPQFPSNSLGKKFSQDSIKEAVTGKRGGEAFYADDFEDQDDERMMQEPLKKPLIEELEEEIEAEEMPKTKYKRTTREAEPIFIRIDKFEESMKIFDEALAKIAEMESLLTEIKRTKEREEKELQDWEAGIKSMKIQIEKVDRDIFSRI